jgi:hypothetical protein
MTYLTRWRLQLAARSLENTPRGVSEIAGDVGYESEAAFNRAFKREFGEPSGRYRLKHKQTFSNSSKVGACHADARVNSSSDESAGRFGISSWPASSSTRSRPAWWWRENNGMRFEISVMC